MALPVTLLLFRGNVIAVTLLMQFKRNYQTGNTLTVEQVEL